jgi:transcription elongation factor GreA
MAGRIPDREESNVTVPTNDESVPMTASGYAERSRELELLRTARRSELSERMREARLDGDGVDNPVLQELLEEQVQLERRIAVLEASLAVAEVVEPTADGRAEIGSIVRVRDRSGRTSAYELVGPLESNVLDGRVSIAAPVGRALVGQRPGATVEADTPRGRLVLEIVSVRPAEPGTRRAA